MFRTNNFSSSGGLTSSLQYFIMHPYELNCIVSATRFLIKMHGKIL